MVLAIMQPYFLPYIGYFQLLNAVDKFVLYDDVNFINRGFINRNNILINGKASLFTIPLKEASQNKLIRDIQVSPDTAWQRKLIKTVEQAYKRAPRFEQVFPLFKEILETPSETISELCAASISKVCNFLEINTEIIPTSTIYNNSELKKDARILDICQQEKATHYINPQGGMALYDKKDFLDKQVRLSFLQAGLTPYPQLNYPFVPGLSILDVLMFNTVAQTRELLNHYELV